MTRLFDRDRIRSALVEKGLADHADALLNLVEPSIRLESQPASDQAIPVASTKLGGAPDLPAGTNWPTFRDQPQSFIAQVNLSELRGLPGFEVLPSSGLLSFFYDSEQSIWGFDPQDRAGWAVHYTPAAVPLHRTSPPPSLPDHGRYSSCRLIPRIEMTFAPWECSDVEQLGLMRSQITAYAEAVPNEPDALTHRLLGHPDPVQGDMQLEAQLAFHGLYCGDATGYEDPRAKQLGPGSTDWRLLLQIDSDESAGMMWGDAGRIYYWNRRSDLARSRFDDVWMILQCG